MSTDWYKSSYSAATAACVEVAVSSDRKSVSVRDSKNPDGAILTYQAAAWQSFIQDIQEDRFRRA
ncbi:DUF397 domain-containing protein [Actinoplanes oblitus]|uniref:DUF397 domain-containing protein n=1 Tax=Actinoplanes oblitus TaxID=3040509 RepID=A0ABY8W7S5_9ACTN|nr:DUF397 domain-containing protein [Actinoplanes oblitus]WIM93904.1 DUF397 domain-containing protein [Actinoplanes oblitus]